MTLTPHEAWEDHGDAVTLLPALLAPVRMADLIYCGTEKVGAQETRAMLAGPYAAVWSPPMWRKAPVEDDDRLWLRWRPTNMAFLRQRDVRVPDDSPEIWGLGEVPVGLSSASVLQTRVLERVLPL